jgi:hypothetical protein
MSLEGTLTVDVGSGAVEFALTIDNGGTEPAEVTYRSGLHADFAVSEGADGPEVWRWSEGRMFTQAIETETLEPGESVRYTAAWEDPSPGEYAVTASLAAADADLERRKSFTV